MTPPCEATFRAAKSRSARLRRSKRSPSNGVELEIGTTGCLIRTTFGLVATAFLLLLMFAS